jgi:hypothetical protein
VSAIPIDTHQTHRSPDLYHRTKHGLLLATRNSDTSSALMRLAAAYFFARLGNTEWFHHPVHYEYHHNGTKS